MSNIANVRWRLYHFVVNPLRGVCGILQYNSCNIETYCEVNEGHWKQVPSVVIVVNGVVVAAAAVAIFRGCSIF